MAVRAVAAARVADGRFEFPYGWEWMVHFVFPKPLPVGTSGEALSDYSVTTGQLTYQGQRVTPSRICVVVPGESGVFTQRTSVNPRSPISFAYATQTLVEWFRSAGAIAASYDLAALVDRERFDADLRASFSTDSGTATIWPLSTRELALLAIALARPVGSEFEGTAAGEIAHAWAQRSTDPSPVQAVVGTILDRLPTIDFLRTMSVEERRVVHEAVASTFEPRS
jgi:hypothetical protein